VENGIDLVAASEIRLEKFFISHHDIIPPPNLGILDIGNEYFYFIDHLPGMIYPLVLLSELDKRRDGKEIGKKQ
jgi:hypothetical protein